MTQALSLKKLLITELVGAAANIKVGQTIDPACEKSSYPRRTVSSSTSRATTISWQLQPESKRARAFARRVNHDGHEPSLARAMRYFLSLAERKPSQIMLPVESEIQLTERFFGF